MDTDRSHMTERILRLTLEIIYLLTGEDYVVIKKTLVTNMAPSCLPLVPEGGSRNQSLILELPPHCTTSERPKDQKILKVTQKIIDLLMGEELSHGGGHEGLEEDAIMENFLKSPDSLPKGNHLSAPSMELQMTNPSTTGFCSAEEFITAHSPTNVPEISAPCRHVHAVHIQTSSPHIKEKMAYGPADMDSPRKTQMPIGVKNNSALSKEEGLVLPANRSTPDHIKEDPDSSNENDLLHEEHISVIVKEEPASGDDKEHLPDEDQSHMWMETSGSEIQLDYSKCYICNQDLSPQETVHIQGDPYPYTTCGTCFMENGQVMTHQTMNIVDKRYSCSECGKSFANNSHLIRHQRIHSGDKPYSCPDCGRSFNNSSHLIRHQRVHTGDKPYSCLQCGRCFSNNSHLVIHQRVHTGDKPYSCDECGKSFGTKQNMDRHKRIHTGEKPFDCPVCKRSFAHKSAMIKHERIHTGERPYTCGKCGKGFVAKSELVKHERTHTGEKPYECNECGKRFSRNYELGLHKKIHTGEKPHCCPQCGKWFLRKYEFVLHERTHTGEIPYCCSICGEGFSHRTNFSRHLSTHTTYNP